MNNLIIRKKNRANSIKPLDGGSLKFHEESCVKIGFGVC